MELARLEQLIQDFRRRRVLVVGDCMLDEYLWGAIRRISPEAPVMVRLYQSLRIGWLKAQP